MAYEQRNTLVINAIKVDRSIVACSRIARFLREKFGYAVLDSSSVSLQRGRYDNIILINSPWGFCDASHRERVGDLVAGARRVVWVQNDYNGGIGPRSLKQLSHEWLNKGRPLAVWTTVPHFLEKWKGNEKIPLDAKRSAYVNWNALHYQPRRAAPPSMANLQTRTRAILYYGAFRPGRAEKFETYFGRKSKFNLVVSTSKVYGAKAFRPLLGSRPGHTELIDPLPDPIAALSTYAATVYLEDEFAREHYVSPAGRFYEALAARTVQLVDADAGSTLLRAGLTVPEKWIVRSAADVGRWLGAARSSADVYNEAVEQLNVWARVDPRKVFGNQLRKAMSL